MLSDPTGKKAQDYSRAESLKFPQMTSLESLFVGSEDNFGEKGGWPLGINLVG